MKILTIGDAHATPTELGDCSKLVDYVIKTAKETNPDYILFLGDQYNYHNIVHISVVDFWTNSFKKIKDAGFNVMALLGNHELSNPKDQKAPHALAVHKKDITIVDEPKVINNVLFLPYFVNNSDFIEVCNKNPTHTVVCHQTFNGAKYDNGMYAPDGVEPDSVPQRVILSGHIHTPQDFGKVLYIGAPRWRTLNDANVKRYMALIDFNEAGVPNFGTIRRFYTEEVCRPIYNLVDSPEHPAVLNKNPGAMYTIDIHGPKDYVYRRAKELEAKNVKTRTYPEQQEVKIKESEGLATSFYKYFETYIPKQGTAKAKLLEIVKEII